MDNSRGQKIWIGVFDEDKAADYESLETYSKYASKHELVKSNSISSFYMYVTVLMLANYVLSP